MVPDVIPLGSRPQTSKGLRELILILFCDCGLPRIYFRRELLALVDVCKLAAVAANVAGDTEPIFAIALAMWPVA